MGSDGRRWVAVLEGDDAGDALAAIRAIAGALATPDLGAGPDLSGDAASALFFAYLAETLGSGDGDDPGERADLYLERAVDGVAATLSSPALFGGFAGVAWVVEHLAGGGDDDLNADIDGVLVGSLDGDRWSGRHDLVSGLAGLALYLAERGDRQPARGGLERVVDRLEQTAERDLAGARWLTPATALPEHQRRRAPRGYYNLGVAHGAPGVIAALARAVEVTGDDRARALAGEAVRWLLAQLYEGDDSWLGNWIPVEGEVGLPRTAWCYGDLGAAVALAAAADAAGEPAWRERAAAIGSAAARRSRETTRVIDAGLCHGAVGLAHMFNRLYCATGEVELLDAARRWYAEALAMREPGAGIAGFWTHVPRADPPREADRSLLTGVAGIGLALIAAVSDLEPAWDRLLAMSGGAGDS